MPDDAQEAKRRFDDAYRALLVIGPALSFSFSNYAPIGVLKDFVTNIGFPALMTAILLWTVPHLLKKSWEFQAKFAGYVFIWFTFLVLASIVYIGSDPRSVVFYLVAVILTLVVTYLTGRIMTQEIVVSKRFSILMLALAIYLSIISLPLTMPQ